MKLEKYLLRSYLLIEVLKNFLRNYTFFPLRIKKKSLVLGRGYKIIKLDNLSLNIASPVSRIMLSSFFCKIYLPTLKKERILIYPDL